jgi:hypothetical protein
MHNITLILVPKKIINTKTQTISAITGSKFTCMFLLHGRFIILNGGLFIYGYGCNDRVGHPLERVDITSLLSTGMPSVCLLYFALQ